MTRAKIPERAPTNKKGILTRVTVTAYASRWFDILSTELGELRNEYLYSRSVASLCRRNGLAIVAALPAKSMLSMFTATAITTPVSG